jgi:hypothetical protein
MLAVPADVIDEVREDGSDHVQSNTVPSHPGLGHRTRPFVQTLLDALASDDFMGSHAPASA